MVICWPGVRFPIHTSCDRTCQPQLCLSFGHFVSTESTPPPYTLKDHSAVPAALMLPPHPPQPPSTVLPSLIGPRCLEGGCCSLEVLIPSPSINWVSSCLGDGVQPRGNSEAQSQVVWACRRQGLNIIPPDFLGG